MAKRLKLIKPINMMHVSLNKSIATQLLRVVFGLYLLVAIIVTGIQMIFEYRYVGDQIKHEIESINLSYGPSISNSIWTYNSNQLKSILIGIQKISSVAGASISDENNNYNIGIVLNGNNEIEIFDRDFAKQGRDKTKIESALLTNDILTTNLLAFDFPVIHEDNSIKTIIGNLTIYSSSEYIFQQVKYGFFLIIINSVIKTIALWIIFVYFLRKILSRPLSTLSSATNKIDLDNVATTIISIDTEGDNELKDLEKSFNKMIRKLAAAKSELDNINRELERKVSIRTQELQKEVVIRKLAQKQAETANNMKSMFLANMSHEIRTPITSMLGMARVLEHQETDNTKKGRLELVVRNGDRLLAIINDILDFSKLESSTIILESIEFNIREFIMENIELFFLKTKEKNIKINYSIEDSVPIVCMGDKTRLNQVLTNLLSNAIKFTENGSVTVNVTTHDNNTKLLFSVSDTGIGIEEDYKSKIFDVFTQADVSTTRKYGGTGLGLAICKRFIELMGGEIWLESRYGKGSTFYFTINKLPIETTI